MCGVIEFSVQRDFPDATCQLYKVANCTKFQDEKAIKAILANLHRQNFVERFRAFTDTTMCDEILIDRRLIMLSYIWPSYRLYYKLHHQKQSWALVVILNFYYNENAICCMFYKVNLIWRKFFLLGMEVHFF